MVLLSKFILFTNKLINFRKIYICAILKINILIFTPHKNKPLQLRLDYLDSTPLNIDKNEKFMQPFIMYENNKISECSIYCTTVYNILLFKIY